MITWSNLSQEDRRHRGSFRHSEKLFAYKDVEFDFIVIRVKGSVTYKYDKKGDSTLKLKLWDKESDETVDFVQLGECVGHSDGFMITEFDTKDMSNELLLRHGNKGELVSCCMQKLGVTVWSLTIFFRVSCWFC